MPSCPSAPVAESVAAFVRSIVLPAGRLHAPTACVPAARSAFARSLPRVAVLLALALSLASGAAGAATSLWPDPITPGFAYDNPAPIECGLKFRADVAGQVTGVRFFKSAGASGTHTGRLYTAGGVKLAEVAFTGETGSGWQTAMFASPVTISANTTYVIACTFGDGNRRFSDTFDYFASSTFNNGVLHGLAEGVDGSNGVYGENGAWLTSSFRSSNYWVDLVFEEGAASDVTPPTVSVVAPVDGAAGVPLATTVTATFNEALDPATVTNATFELRDGASALVPAVVTYVPGAFQAVLTPNASLAPSTLHTATVRGGAPGVKDLAGNALAADRVWTFTTVAPDLTRPTVTATVPVAGATNIPIGSNVTATFSEAMDPASLMSATVELRGASNALVPATVTYDAGTMTVTIAPDASLALATLHTASLVGGPGGVRDLAGNPLATTYTWSFTTETPDVTPPTVASVMPINGSTRLRVQTWATARFSEAMDPASITASSFELRNSGGTLVPATVTYDAATQSATLAPAADLPMDGTYTARVKGGAGGVTDAFHNALAADYSWTFGTIKPRPAVDAAPGGPILVITSPGNLYTRYLVEILRTEGLNEFDVADLGSIDASRLSNYDVAVLGEMPLSAADVALLTGWVTNGGHLIAMRPDKQLASLLGLADAGNTVANGYLAIDTSRQPGTGIVGQTLQFHGTADAYTVAGATALATLYSNLTTSTAWPAITINSHGSQGGTACAFTFDLARSIVWTHQGNPAWQTGHVNPHQTYGTAVDLFWPDWIDFNRITIPQADEQQRFFAKLIEFVNADRKPLPRFWYLPKGKKAAIILTGDDHWGRSSPAGSSQVFFDRHKAQSPAGCSPDDWECIRSSTYAYPGCLLTDAQAAAYSAEGFEIGQHADAGLASTGDWCGTWPADARDKYTAQIDLLMRKYASVPVQLSERDHCYSYFGYDGPAGWLPYAGIPEVEGDIGIHFDTNISYNPASWATVNPGYQMGSGMMMRMAQVNPAGAMTRFLDVYNGGTQMNDDNGQGAAAMRSICDAFLDNAVGPNGFYGGFVVNMHSDNWYGWSYDGSDQVVASAIAHQVPVVSGKQMVDWLDGRNNSAFNGLTWDGATLSFSVAVAAGARNMLAMLPARHGAAPLSALTRDGQSVAYTYETIKGVQVAFFPATAGVYAATYAPDLTPPAIASVSAAAIDGHSAVVSWSTNEPATSRVDFGVSPGSLVSSVVDAALLGTHALTLTGLLPNTTYWYRVTSVDESNNSATAPPAPGTPASFTTPSASFADITLADFTLGSADAGIARVEAGDGDVILAPTALAEFAGTTLPAGWAVISGGTATVSGGVLTLNGSTVGTTGTYPPGRSVEAVATFTGGQYQHVGFGVTYNTGAGEAWAMLSTGSTGTGLFARCWTGSGPFDTQITSIPGSWLGTPHRYRVDWMSDHIDYYVDGALVATHAIAIPTSMRPLVSVGPTGAFSLAVDWVRMSPYAPSGTFLSRVFDARGPADWQGLSWNADLPSGGTLAMSARTGNVAVPDATWSPFVSIPSPGAAIGATTRYVQYRAQLATTDALATTALHSVTLAYHQDQAPPPLIGAVSATPTSAYAANVTWTTDVGATSRVDYGTNPAALTSNVADPTLVTSHTLALTGLQPNTTYHYRVTSADASASASTAPEPPAAPLTFTTPALGVMDVIAADFALGTPDANIVTTLEGDGELMLAPTVGTEFPGASLPPGWSSSGGTATVASGRLTVNGSTVGPTASYGPGRSVEVVATFTANVHEHVGFGVNLTGGPGDAWAIISTGAGGAGLSARTWTGSGGFDTERTDFDPTGALIGTPHRYRVDWNGGVIDYWVDGVKVATHHQKIATAMRPLVSQGSVGGTSLSAEWLHMSPYASPGVFRSRVFDGGTPALWTDASWTADLPSGTSLGLRVRAGNTPAPDGTWTAFTTVASSGGAVALNGRYAQYEATLATGDPVVSPLLRDVRLGYGPAPQTTVAAAVAPGTYVSNLTPCVPVPVVLSRTDATPARAVSVGIRLSSGLKLCDTPANSIHQGSWLDGAPSAFQVIDQGGGLYQVDQSILGGPCGATTGGTLFTLDVTNAGADGVGALTVENVTLRDCANADLTVAPGAPASLPIDRTPPGAATAVTATASGGPGANPGTRKIALAFTAPPDAATIEVYRAPFGGHPLYSRPPGGGQTPAPPVGYPPPAPWVRVPGMNAPGSDDPGAREFWHYVIARRDAAGNVTYAAAANGALSYVLGDVSDGTPAGACVGDNQVSLADISFLGAHYGEAVASSAAWTCLDVGPTADFRATSRPAPDGKLDFEDLALFAIDWGSVVSASQSPPIASLRPTSAPGPRATNAVALDVPATLPGAGGTFEVGIQFDGNGEVRALSVDLDWDAAVVTPVGAADGELPGNQGVPFVRLSSHPGNVDVALLGAGFSGHGRMATVTFRVIGAGDARIALGPVRARDAANRDVTLGRTLAAPELPVRSTLSRGMPTPFRDATTFEYALARVGDATLAIYGVDGRRIRTLVSGPREAGFYRAVWDGRDDDGRTVSSGMYFARLTTADVRQTRTIVRVQ